MTQQGRKHKVSHPGYGKVEGFNHKMDCWFTSDIDDILKARDRRKEQQKQYDKTKRNRPMVSTNLFSFTSYQQLVNKEYCQ